MDQSTEGFERRSVRYVTRIPRKPLPESEILVHNRVLPAPRLGERGFRAWTQRLDRLPPSRSAVAIGPASIFGS